MAANGVVHHTVADDFTGVIRALQWLAYVPPKRGSPLPALRGPLLGDPVGRPVAYRPVTACDPRCAIQGELGGQDGATWQGGIFDRGSFMEVWLGWARTVVTGRARLGGVPMGVIAVETSTVQFTVPSDPARPEAGGRTVIQVSLPTYTLLYHVTLQYSLPLVVPALCTSAPLLCMCVPPKSLAPLCQINLPPCQATRYRHCALARPD